MELKDSNLDTRKETLTQVRRKYSDLETAMMTSNIVEGNVPSSVSLYFRQTSNANKTQTRKDHFCDLLDGFLKVVPGEKNGRGAKISVFCGIHWNVCTCHLVDPLKMIVIERQLQILFLFSFAFSLTKYAESRNLMPQKRSLSKHD